MVKCKMAEASNAIIREGQYLGSMTASKLTPGCSQKIQLGNMQFWFIWEGNRGGRGKGHRVEQHRALAEKKF